MKQLIAAVIVVLTLGGCATPPTLTPVALAPTQTPTWTPQPTNTPVPTNTPSATPTPVPPTATATASATASPTIAPTSTSTPTRVPTAKPTSAPTSAPPVVLPPTGMVFQAPKLVQPAEGSHLKIDHSAGVGSYANSITFEWLPVGTLENGKIRCSWKDQPNGTEAAIFDRYLVRLDPPLPKESLYSNQSQPIDTFTDAGTKIIVGLERFHPDTTYTWKVAVGRWCVIALGVRRENFMGLLSPYSESRTFRYSP